MDLKTQIKYHCKIKSKESPIQIQAELNKKELKQLFLFQLELIEITPNRRSPRIKSQIKALSKYFH